MSILIYRTSLLRLKAEKRGLSPPRLPEFSYIKVKRRLDNHIKAWAGQEQKPPIIIELFIAPNDEQISMNSQKR